MASADCKVQDNLLYGFAIRFATVLVLCVWQNILYGKTHWTLAVHPMHTWIQDLNTRFEYKIWIQDFNTRCEYEIWIQDLNTRFEYKIWIQGSKITCGNKSNIAPTLGLVLSICLVPASKITFGNDSKITPTKSLLLVPPFSGNLKLPTTMSRKTKSNRKNKRL